VGGNVVWKIVVDVEADVIVKVSELDAAPPGFRTVTDADPGAAIRLAGTCAVNCDELTKLVPDNADPFHTICAPDKNPCPLSVNVKAAPPAIAEVGLNVDIGGEATFEIANGSTFDVALVPLGLMIVILTVPEPAISPALTIAVNCEELTNVVGSSPPFQAMAAPLAKLLPLAVSVNCPPPTVAEFGLSELSTGVLAAPTVKASAFEAVDPVTTVMLADPAEASRLLETEASN